MTMPRHTGAQIDSATKLVATALAGVVPTERAIRNRLDDSPEWPERTDRAGGRSGGSSSVVERVALDTRRPSPLTLERDHKRIAELYDAIIAAAHQLIDYRDRYAIVQPPNVCVGGVGFEWWPDGAKTKCDRWQEEGRSSGLCGACRKKRDDWRRNNERVA